MYIDKRKRNLPVGLEKVSDRLVYGCQLPIRNVVRITTKVEVILPKAKAKGKDAVR